LHLAKPVDPDKLEAAIESAIVSEALRVPRIRGAGGAGLRLPS